MRRISGSDLGKHPVYIYIYIYIYIFFFFFFIFVSAWGGGRGSPRRQEGGGGRFFIEIPRGGEGWVCVQMLQNKAFWPRFTFHKKPKFRRRNHYFYCVKMGERAKSL